MQKTYKQLFIMIIIFVLPVIIGGILFHYHAYFNLKTLNHGTLLHPPLDVKYLYSETENSQQKKWRVIYVSNESCDSQCQQIYHQLQQVKKALGKDTDRVSTILLNSKNAQIQQLKTALIQQVNQSFVASHKIYLVDPLGNLFMYYPDTIDPMDVLKDLKRLLEVSQIG